MNAVLLPTPYFADPDTNEPISGGFVYIGVINEDPTILENRVTLTLIEQDGTEVEILPAAQPLETGAGGVVIYNNSPIAQIWVDTDYSMAVLRDDLTQAYYFPVAGVPNIVNNVQNSSYTYLSNVSGTNVITADASPSLSAYVVGQTFEFIPANDNTGAVTLNINTLGAGNVLLNGSALIAGDIGAGIPVTIMVTDITPIFAITGNGKFRTQSDIESGTKMVFMQDAAPTGWTFVSSNDDSVLLNTSTEGDGGDTGGSWTISGLTGPSHTHDLGSHTHDEGSLAVSKNFTGADSGSSFSAIINASPMPVTGTTGAASGNTGSGGTGSVVSTGAWRPAYVKVITCSKD